MAALEKDVREALEKELRDIDRLANELEQYELVLRVPAIIDKLHTRTSGLTELDCIVILNVLHRWLRSHRSK